VILSFFFSSRRRHTRFSRDWSSDVCSSDLMLLEAARTLGASPLRAFFNVVLPALRNPVIATSIMVFVFALGSYLLPQILGRPKRSEERRVGKECRYRW